MRIPESETGATEVEEEEEEGAPEGEKTAPLPPPAAEVAEVDGREDTLPVVFCASIIHARREGEGGEEKGKGGGRRGRLRK